MLACRGTPSSHPPCRGQAIGNKNHARTMHEPCAGQLFANLCSLLVPPLGARGVGQSAHLAKEQNQRFLRELKIMRGQTAQ